MKSIVAVSLALAAASVNAHFTLDYPETALLDYKKMTTFCGGVTDLGSSKLPITEVPIGKDVIQLTSEHTNWVISGYIALHPPTPKAFSDFVAQSNSTGNSSASISSIISSVSSVLSNSSVSVNRSTSSVSTSTSGSSSLNSTSSASSSASISTSTTGATDKNSTVPTLFSYTKGTGNKSICIPVDYSKLGSIKPKNNSTATILILYDGGDSPLYQCANVRFLESVKGYTDCLDLPINKANGTNGTNATGPIDITTVAPSALPTGGNDNSAAVSSASIVAIVIATLVSVVAAAAAF